MRSSPCVCFDRAWACAYLRVLHTVYSGVSCIFSKPIAHCIGRSALLPFLPALFSVFHRLNSLATRHWTVYNAAQAFFVFDHLTCVGWSALANAVPGGVPWLCYNSGTGVAPTPLLASVPYRILPTINVLTAFRLPDDYFRFLESPGRPSEALKTIQSSRLLKYMHLPQPNLYNPPFSFRARVASSSLASAFQHQQSSLAPSAMAFAVFSLSACL